MTIDELRLEALCLANNGEPPECVVARAAAYLDFLLGADEMTPRARIVAALDDANVM